MRALVQNVLEAGNVGEEEERLVEALDEANQVKAGEGVAQPEGRGRGTGEVRID